MTNDEKSDESLLISSMVFAEPEEDSKEKPGKQREKPYESVIKGVHEQPRDIVAEIQALREAFRPKKPVVKEAPKMELLTGGEYHLRPGNNLRVGVRLSSDVKSVVELLSGAGNPLPASTIGRYLVEQFGDDFYLNLRNVTPADAGSYMIQAKNLAGESTVPISLFITSEPTAPKGPLEVKVVEQAKGRMEGAVAELSWNKCPLRHGEKAEFTEPVLGYVVERREGQRRMQFGRPIRVEGPENLSLRVADLKPGVEYTFRVSAFNVVGTGEPLLSEPIAIKTPFGTPGAPIGPLKCIDLTEDSLHLSWSPPISDGGLPVKRYHLEMKDVGHPAGWVPLGSVLSETTSYLVSGLQSGLAYRFRVRAVNEEGPGDWLETDKSIAFSRPVTSPSEPEGSLRLLSEGENAVRLSWHPPLDDGGAPVKDYIVEACLDHALEEWFPAGMSDTTNKRVDGLLHDAVYTFRVSARNEADKVGPPLYSEVYKPAAPIGPPGPPTGPLRARCTGKGQIDLKWEPPRIGGPQGFGAPDEYLIERYEVTKARWTYVGRQPVSAGTQLIVFGLQPGGEYRFRVRAENRAGGGPPLESDKPIVAASPFGPPGVPVGPINISEVQKGSSRSDGSARISWNPPIETGGLPVLRYVAQMRYANTPGWHRISGARKQPSGDEDALEVEQGVLVVPTTTLVTGLMQSKHYVFRVAAVNESGTGPFLESGVFEMPEDEGCRPKADWIRVVGKSADSVTVEWLVPHDCRRDHGPNRPHHLAIDSYRVFIRPAIPAGTVEAPWKPVADLDHYMNRLVVGNLSRDRSYYFGVAVVNQSGQGEIISTKEPVSPEAISTVPSQPIGPLRAYDITEVGCTLSWSSPASDGGSPILGYRVYKREMYRRSWQEIGRLTEAPGLPLAKTLTFPVQYLMQATAYEFRVVAENKIGLSEPLHTHANVHPTKATDVPSPPRGPLRVRELSDDGGSLELAWSPPTETGGLPIIGYQLEVREGRSFSWRSYPSDGQLVATGPNHKFQPSHLVSGIQPNREYFFRVSAVNKDGVSQPLTAGDSYMKRIKLEAPKRVLGRRITDADHAEELRPILQVEWEFETPTIYEPQPTGFQIDRLDNDSRIAKWEPVDFVPISDRHEQNYVHQSIAPRSDSSYKFRVSTIYLEGASQAVMSGVILASPPTFSRPESSASQPFVPPVPSVRLAEYKGFGYDLEWAAPKGPGAEAVRGYSIETWDAKRQHWEPVIDVPKEGPLRLSLAGPSAMMPTGKPVMRIISRGDTTRSAPVEFTLQSSEEEPYRSPYTILSMPEWKTLPSVSGYPTRPSTAMQDGRQNAWDEFEYEPEAYLSRITGAGSPEVDEFIRNRRYMVQDMIKRDLASSTGRRSALSQRSTEYNLAWGPAVPFERPSSRASIRTPFGGMLIPGHMSIEELSPTSVRLSWPEPDRDAERPASYEVQRWEPRSTKWMPIAQVPSRSTEYTISGLRSDGESGWWFRVVPLDAEDHPIGPPIQMESPYYPKPRQITVPSSVWGVELAPIYAPIDLRLGTMEVKWMKPSNDGGSRLLGYRLIAYDADAGEAKETVVQPNQTTICLDGLDATHVHRVTITAFNRVGDSLPVTSTAPARPGTPGMPSAPSPPTDFHAEVVEEPMGDKSMCILSWRPPSRTTGPVDFYVIEKWSSDTKQWVPFKKVTADVNTIEVPHLLDDVEYDFRVRSQNIAGLSQPVGLRSRIRPGLAKEVGPGQMPLAPPKPKGPLELRQSTTQDEGIRRLQLAVDAAYKVVELCWESSVPSEDELDRYGPIRAYAIEAKRHDQKFWSLITRIPAARESRWNILFGPEPQIYEPTLGPVQPHPLTSLGCYMESNEWVPPQSRRFYGEPPKSSWLRGELKDYDFRVLAENEFGRSEPLYGLADQRDSMKPIRTRERSVSPVSLLFYSPVSLTPPRGPIKFASSTKLQTPLVELEELELSWRPPYDAKGVIGYEVFYRSPFETEWHSIGRTSITETSLKIPRSVLDASTGAIHVGIRTIGEQLPGMREHPVSERIEEVLSMPRLPESGRLLSRTQSPIGDEIMTSLAPTDVRASLFRPSLTVGDTDEIIVAWSLPKLPYNQTPVRPVKMADKYAVFARELGKVDWVEVDRVPGMTRTAHFGRSKVPVGEEFFIGVAPVIGPRIGPIVSTMDSLRIPEKVPETEVFTTPHLHTMPPESLTIMPTGPERAHVKWIPPEDLSRKLEAYPMTDYHLEVRNLDEHKWRPLRPKQRTTDLSKPQTPVVPSFLDFELDHVRPGESLEVRVTARPVYAATSIPITESITYRQLPPYDIPSRPVGPLIAQPVHTVISSFSRRPSSALSEIDLIGRTISSPVIQPKTDQLETPIIRLTWHPPLDIGGTPITEYVIERRAGPQSGPSRDWVPVLTVPGTLTKAVVPMPGVSDQKPTPYSYRVRAVNVMGISSPLETTYPVYAEDMMPSWPSSRTGYQPRLPDAPRGPLRSQLLPSDRGVRLDWRLPLIDDQREEERAARPISYVIEATQADIPDAPWIEVGRVPGSETSVDVPLPPTSRFLFEPTSMDEIISSRPMEALLYRVRSENEFGLSAPLVTRVEPDLYPSIRHERRSKIPGLAPGYLETRILPEQYPGHGQRIELRWPSVLTRAEPELGLCEPSRRWTSDVSYLIEARQIGDFGWQPIATLPIGQEYFIYRPASTRELYGQRPRSAMDYGQHRVEPPRPQIPSAVEAYQFRVAPGTQLETGDYLESDVISWIPSYPGLRPILPMAPKHQTMVGQSPSSMQTPSPRVEVPSIRPPERFQLVDVIPPKPDERLETGGTAVLRWHPPSGMSSTLRSAADFVIEAWQPERQTWWSVGRYSAAISAETVPGRYDVRLSGLPVDRFHYFRVLTEMPEGRSEPTLLPQPVFIPLPEFERRTIPEPPTRLRVAPLGGKRPGVLLTWLPPPTSTNLQDPRIDRDTPRIYFAPPAGYKVEYQLASPTERDSTSWYHVADLESWQTSLEIPNLKPGKKYVFRVMSVGRSADGGTSIAFTEYGRASRAGDKCMVLGEPIVSKPYEIPTAMKSIPRLTGELIVRPLFRAKSIPAASLIWEPIKEPITGYMIDLYDLDQPDGWRTVTRIPAEDVQIPFSGATVTGLRPGRSYLFRVLPYRDDEYGKPLQSVQMFTVPRISLGEESPYTRRMTIQAPRGPLIVDRISPDMCRLSWFAPSLSTIMESSLIRRVEDDLEYVIEQRLPQRRMWYEVGRTRSLHYTVPIDATSQFRVRAVLAETPGYRVGKSGICALSEEGVTSDWIVLDDEGGEPSRLRRTRFSGRRASADVVFDLDCIIPSRIDIAHVGRASALLRWSPILADKKHLTCSSLLLEKRVIDHSRLGVWEPIAQFPLHILPIPSTYEVYGLRPGFTYEFRLVAVEDMTGTRSSKSVQTRTQIITQGAPEIVEQPVRWLPAPRHLRAYATSEDGQDGVKLKWLAPEVPDSLQSKLRYDIQAKALDSTGDTLSGWLHVITGVPKTEYFASRDRLEEIMEREIGIRQAIDTIVGAKRRSTRSLDMDQRHWQFKVVARCDDVESAPAAIQETLTLVPLSRRKPLRFLNLKDDRMIYSVLGQRLVLTVEVEGEPTPSVTWYLNNIRLDDRISSVFRVSQIGAGVFELAIDRIHRSHAGLLECRAWNAHELITTFWELVVSAVPRFSRFGWTIEPREFELKHGDHWLLRIPLENVNYAEDYEWITKVWLERLTRIPAVAEGVDMGDSLEARAHLMISEGFRWIELTVERISLADAGLYRLWIQNQAGQDFIDLRLRVADKPHIKPNKPCVRAHGPRTLVIDWDLTVPESHLEVDICCTGFRVEYRREVPGASWFLLGTTPANVSHLLVGSQLEPGIPYRFRICLENWHGLGPFSEPSDVAQLPAVGTKQVLDMEDKVCFVDDSFESRYAIASELARTRHAGLYRLQEKATGRYWLAKIVETGRPERRLSSAQGYRAEERRESLPPRSTSVLETTSLADRHSSVGLSSSRTSLTDGVEWRRERTEEELRLFARLEHEGLAKFHEAYRDSKRTIMVIEDVTGGGTLWHDLSRRIIVTENKAADIMRQLLELTDQLHRSGVVHVGLQPESVFYADCSKSRVALAGIEHPRPMDEGKPVRLTFRSKVYLPPELRAPTPTAHHISPATDVWSLGLLLYQMTTGDVEGTPEISRMEKMKLSPTLVDLTRKLLHAEPSRRPTAAEALKHPFVATNTRERIEMDIRRASVERLLAEEPTDHSVQESISKRAYTRLLRWIDASHIDDESEAEEGNAPRRKYRRGSRQYTSQTGSELMESCEEIIVHACVQPRGGVPAMLTPVGSMTVEEGCSTALRCAVHLPRSHKPVVPADQMSDLKISWSLNGRDLLLAQPVTKLKQPPEQHYTCTYDPETGDIRLHIHEVTMYDAGTYEVTITGRYGQVSDSANLKVYAAPQRLSGLTEVNRTDELGARIMQPLMDVSSSSGNRIQLKAKVSGIPAPRHTWLHNGVPLMASVRRRFYQEPLVGVHSSEMLVTLELVNLTSADAGLYTLVATNKYGSQSCSAVVDVLADLSGDHEAPRFLVELVSVTVVEGSAARFEACVRGRPAPTVRWLKDGKPLLTDGLRLTVSQSANDKSTLNTTSHSLLIRDTLPRDSGTYTCIATSASGTAITEAGLNVRGLFQRGAHGAGAVTVGLGLRQRQPEFTRRLRNQQVALGSIVRLAASVLSQPSPTVVWQRDGVELTTDYPASEPRITAKNQSGHLELIIEDVTKNDMGQYTVIAYNAAGEARCSCLVSLMDETQFRLPRFVRELRDSTVMEGGTLILEAEATGNPMPDFKWEKDGFELFPDDSGASRITINTRVPGVAILTISHFRPTDAGLYRCIAHNRYGRERSTSFVYIESTGRSIGQGTPDLHLPQTNGHAERDRSLRPVGTRTAPGADTISHLPGLMENKLPARVSSPIETGFMRIIKALPKQIEVDEGEAISLVCLVSTNIHYIPTWSKSGRTLTYDGRRRITRSKSGELMLAIDHAMTNDEGRYTLTLEPSDANAPKDLEPVVQVTRVIVNMKVRSRVGRESGSRGSSRSNSRAPSILTSRLSRDSVP